MTIFCFLHRKDTVAISLFRALSNGHREGAAADFDAVRSRKLSFSLSDRNMTTAKLSKPGIDAIKLLPHFREMNI